MAVDYKNYPREKSAYKWIGDREINNHRVEGAAPPSSKGALACSVPYEI